MPLAPDSTTSPQTGRAKMTRSEAARHAANVRYGKEQPFAARLAAIREARKQRKAKGKGKGKKPALTPEQRKQARTAEQAKQQAANRETVKNAMADGDVGLSPSGFDGLMNLGDGKEPDKAMADGLVSMGMAERGGDGVLRLTPAGREAINAADRGDAKGAIDAVSRGADRAAQGAEREKAKGERASAAEQRKQEIAQRKAEREKAAAEKEKKQSSSGGGGKGGKDKAEKPTKEERDAERAQQRQQERATNRTSVQAALEKGAGQSLNGLAFDTLTSFADGGDGDPEILASLAEHTGLVEKDSAGGYRMTAEGRQYVSAADKGNVRAAGDAMSRALDRVAPKDTGPTEADANRAADRAVSQDRLKYRKRRQTWKSVEDAMDIIEQLISIRDTLTAEGEAGNDAIKAGRRNSASDQAMVQQIFELANELEEIAIALGADPGDDVDEEDEAESADEDMAEGGMVETKGISQAQRDDMDESDFAGPHQSFPIRNAADVANAARLIGHADNPEAVKRKIIAIARRKGLEDAIPEAWATKKDAEDLIFSTEGSAIKALDGDAIGGYAVLFGAPDMHDLSAQRDYFDRNTDFWLKRFGWPRPMTYHHGLDPDTADDPIVGEWKSARVDNVGVWLEGQLDKAHKYHGAVKELIKRGYLKLSSDSAPQWVQRERNMDTGANYVKRWPLITASTTVTPAEPRMAGLTFKALLADLGLDDIDDNSEATDTDARERPDEVKASNEYDREKLLLKARLLELETTV